MLVPAYFIASRQIIRSHMLENMENQNLVSLEVPATEFQWYEEGKEIIINGRMFDVKSIALSGGVYFIKGLFDEKETELKQALQDQQDHQDGKTHYAQQLVQFIMVSAEINEETPALTSIKFLSPPRVEYGNSFFPQHIGAIVVPPPDYCLQFRVG